MGNISYHSNIKIKYKLGILPINQLECIPSSTLSNWKNYDTSKIFGIKDNDIFTDHLEVMKAFLSRKHLLKIAKILFHVSNIQRKIFSKIKSYKNVAKEFMPNIIQLIERNSKNISKERILTHFQIKQGQYKYWKRSIKPCLNSIFSICKKAVPNQLTKNEALTIKNYMTDLKYKYWSSVSVYYQAIKDKAIAFHLNTWYLYVKKLNIERFKISSRRKKHLEGIRADKPKQILHMDVTIFKPLNNVKVYIYLIVDNYSRAILSGMASLKYSASIAKENLLNAVKTHKLLENDNKFQLITDDGSENMGDVVTYISEHEQIQKLIAQKDITFSNSLIEAVNKKLKYQNLYTRPFSDELSVINYLSQAISEYNDRPYGPHRGLSCNQVLAGANPIKNGLTYDSKEARIKRYLENTKDYCDNC